MYGVDLGEMGLIKDMVNLVYRVKKWRVGVIQGAGRVTDVVLRRPLGHAGGCPGTTVGAVRPSSAALLIMFGARSGG